jgi:nitroreductase
MEFEELYKKRRSYRFLTGEKIDEGKIEKILDAGMHAPVAMGSYSNLKLFVLTGDKLEKTRQLFVEAIKNDPTYGASLVVVVAHKGKNIELSNQDVGCIGENMLLEATELGLGSVYSYTIPRVARGVEAILKLRDLGEGFTPLAAMVIGVKKSDEVRPIVHKIEVIR